MNFQKNSIMVVFIYALLLPIVTLISCNTAEPPVPPEIENLSLVQDEISCTESWLKLKTENLQLPAIIRLMQDDNLKKTITLSSQDTVLYIDSLLPNKTYQFQLVTNNTNTKSNRVSVTTLDTTSHNFAWQTFTFGNYDNSVIYDVAIVAENNIWAVGEIYIEDSIGVVKHYNAVHWDGQNWEFKRIKTKACGGADYPPIKAIFAFAANDILFAHLDGSISYFNGIEFTNDCSLIIQLNGSANKILGISKNDFYVVSGNGFIAHYQNGNWTKIESGTNDNLLDVMGTVDGKTVWTCGYSGDYANTVFIRIKDGVAEKVYEGSSNGQSNGYYVGPISGVWTDNAYRLFMMNAGGIYIQQNSNEFFLEKEVARFTHGSYGIDGTRSNNIFACGDRFVGHWNGSTYYEYPELYRQFGTYFSTNAKGNTVSVVGTDYSDGLNFKAIIVLGHK